MEYYDETTYPPPENTPLRYAISRRNKWLVAQADTIIAYIICSWGGAARHRCSGTPEESISILRINFPCQTLETGGISCYTNFVYL